MKKYTECKIEIVYLEDEIVRTSGILLPEDSLGENIGSF